MACGVVTLPSSGTVRMMAGRSRPKPKMKNGKIRIHGHSSPGLNSNTSTVKIDTSGFGNKKREPQWQCVKNCGACCKLDKGPNFPSPKEVFDDASDVEHYRSLIGPDGWCIHFDKATRKCSIYADRPYFCRVEPHIFLTLYGIEGKKFNKEACSSCIDTIKAIYGSNSKELDSFNHAIWSASANFNQALYDTLDSYSLPWFDSSYSSHGLYGEPFHYIQEGLYNESNSDYDEAGDRFHSGSWYSGHRLDDQIYDNTVEGGRNWINEYTSYFASCSFDDENTFGAHSKNPCPSYHLGFEGGIKDSYSITGNPNQPPEDTNNNEDSWDLRKTLGQYLLFSALLQCLDRDIPPDLCFPSFSTCRNPAHRLTDMSSCLAFLHYIFCHCRYN